MNRMSYNTFLNICCKQLRIPCYKRGYMQKSIEVYNLVKRFGEHAAGDSINFTVGEGEIFGLLGPNGAGKTTTLKMLTTLLPPTSRRALIAGYDGGRQPTAARQLLVDSQQTAAGD